MKGENLNYPKVDFSGKWREILLESGAKGFLLALLWIAPFVISLVILALVNASLDTVVLVVQFFFTLILAPVLLLLGYLGYDAFSRYRKCHSPELFMHTLVFLVLISVLLFFLVGILNWNNSLGDTVFEWGPRINLIMLLFLLIPVLIWRFRRQKEDRLFGLYPRIIASAERDTEEYLDGYSQRPVELEFPGTKKSTLRDFAAHLMRHYLVHDYLDQQEGFKFLFPPSARTDIVFKTPAGGLSSWLRVQRGGRAQVFITPEDYQFLEAPLSYHLLCKALGERMAESYLLFAQGEEERALEVFRVEKEVGS